MVLTLPSTSDSATVMSQGFIESAHASPCCP